MIIGNCVTYDVALKLMRAGAWGDGGHRPWCRLHLPRAARHPQATSVADCTARDDYMKESGRYVPIVADGGIVTGGDIASASLAAPMR